MYNTLRFGLFEPKKIMQFKDKSPFYALVFLAILTLFMSIGSFTFYLGYHVPSTLNAESCACVLTDGEITALDGHLATTEFVMYNIPVYVLTQGEDISVLPALEDAFVFSGHRLLVYSSSKVILNVNLSDTLSGSPDLDTVFETVRVYTMWTIIAFNVLINFGLIVLVTLFSTLQLLQYRRMLTYRQNFVMTSIALSPVAIVMTFYNLLSIPSIVFFIALLISYRSMMVLRREVEKMAFEARLAQMPPHDESIPSEEEEPSDEEEVEDNSDENDDETDKYS